MSIFFRLLAFLVAIEVTFGLFCPLLAQPLTLNGEEISRQLETLLQWTIINQQLHRVYEFENFSQAIAFVNRVAQLAENVAHHPDILIQYNRVTLKLTTHDAGGLTQKDFDLARQISQLSL